MTKKGEVLLLTTGMYSDYFPMGLYRAIQDFDMKQLAAQFEPDGSKLAVSEQFAEFLYRERFVEVVPCTEWHLEGHDGLAPHDARGWS